MLLIVSPGCQHRVLNNLRFAGAGAGNLVMGIRIINVKVFTQLFVSTHNNSGRT